MLKRRELANVIRVLSMDAVQKANSGHPGMPMGMADIAEVLWNDFLHHHPQNPKWINRDRFIVSNGHGCMLLYALLHLTGYDLTIDDLKQFRQLHSKTPGHPEFGHTPGVETTTGPLGQGLGNAVGMAIAEKHLSAEFNREGFPLIDHFTYVFVGDGDLMEGVSHEVCSLAGTQGLGKLIVFYDDNTISIDGDVTGWFTDNTPLRFESYGWQVIPDIDGHDPEAVHAAILAARACTDKPTLICCKTIIGWGAPNLAGTEVVHGAPLGEKEIAAARAKLNWPYPAFEVPEAYYKAWDATEKGALLQKNWQHLLANYQAAYPDLHAEFIRRFAKKLPENWANKAKNLIQTLCEKKETMATRKASQRCIQYFADFLPEFMGGSADLTGSNLTNWEGMTVFAKNAPLGQYIHYGVREFGMSTIMNGMALYGGLLPFGGTFLTFSDYARNAVRLSAIMQTQVIFIYSHDSIGLGEDGPTHQPIEQAPSLRMIPGLTIWRPCDSVETAVAWQAAIEHPGPTCLLLTRQNCPCEEHAPDTIADIARGGYTLIDCNGVPQMIMIATGSEVALAVLAAKTLQEEGVLVRVVSMPSVEVFLRQAPAYQEKILPNKVGLRLAIEASATAGWYKIVGCHGKVMGIDRFGASAPAKAVFEDCELTVATVIAAAKTLLTKKITTHFHQDLLEETTQS